MVKLRNDRKTFTHLFSSKRLVDAEMLAIQYSERKVDVNSYRLGGAFPHQIRAQHLVGTRERDGPFLMAASEFFGRNISVRIPGYQFGHHEREHVRLSSIR